MFIILNNIVTEFLLISIVIICVLFIIIVSPSALVDTKCGQHVAKYCKMLQRVAKCVNMCALKARYCEMIIKK